jgi:peptide/nickel transport system permease protein
MGAYVVRRMVAILLVLLAVSVVIFWITQILPGNVAYAILGQFATPEQVAAIQARLGLDRSIPVQYWSWISGVARGDFGNSMLMDRPVAPLILNAMANSMQLAVISMLLVTLIGIWSGVWSALHYQRFGDRVMSFLIFLSLAVPEFFWAIVSVMLFAGVLHWLPATGYAPFADGVGDWAAHLVLPVITLVAGLVPHVSRLTRSSMVETLRAQYIVAARAKGLTERRIVWHHALRNGLLPTITILAVDVGVLMGGIVVVETVFSYPGLGRLLIFAIEQKDIPVIQAGVLVITAVYAFANLGADILYTLLNPRIRYHATAD